MCRPPNDATGYWRQALIRPRSRAELRNAPDDLTRYHTHTPEQTTEGNECAADEAARCNRVRVWRHTLISNRNIRESRRGSTRLRRHLLTRTERTTQHTADSVA